MLIKNRVNLNKYRADLDRLFVQCFDGARCSDSDPSDLRSIELLDAKVVSHASVQKRPFDFIKRDDVETYILGYVCTDLEHRGKGFASKTIREIAGHMSGKPWILVLHCEDSKVEFYQKHGFEIVSEKGSYFRNGKIEIEDGPVMVLCSIPDLKNIIVRGSVLHLGDEY